MPSEIYDINNQWDGLVGGVIYQAYAGLNKITIPPQGVLLVRATRNDTDTIMTTGEFLVPASTGGLKLVSFKATQLTMEDITSKQRFVFDVGTRQWLTPP